MPKPALQGPGRSRAAVSLRHLQHMRRGTGYCSAPLLALGSTDVSQSFPRASTGVFPVARGAECGSAEHRPSWLQLQESALSVTKATADPSASPWGRSLLCCGSSWTPAPGAAPRLFGGERADPELPPYQ